MADDKVQELLLIDDILAPKDAVMVKFQGKNPFTAAAMAPNVIKRVMKIPGKDLLETDVRWDATGENRDFYGKWMGKRKEDQWTQTRIRIVIQGSQHAKEKTGWVNVEIKGTIRTSYKFSNFLQRAFWMIYNKKFYNQHRRMIMEAAKDDIYDIKEIYQQAFGIEPRP